MVKLPSNMFVLASVQCFLMLNDFRNIVQVFFSAFAGFIFIHYFFLNISIVLAVCVSAFLHCHCKEFNNVYYKAAFFKLSWILFKIENKEKYLQE